MGFPSPNKILRYSQGRTNLMHISESGDAMHCGILFHRWILYSLGGKECLTYYPLLTICVFRRQNAVCFCVGSVAGCSRLHPASPGLRLWGSWVCGQTQPFCWPPDQPLSLQHNHHVSPCLTINKNSKDHFLAYNDNKVQLHQKVVHWV